MGKVKNHFHDEICRRADEGEYFDEDLEYQIWNEEQKIDWLTPTLWAIVAFIPLSVLFSLIWVATP